MATTKLDQLIDKKILFLHWPVSKFNVLEGKVKEYSPSKTFMKVSNDWYLIDNIRILEIFPEEKRTLGF